MTNKEAIEELKGLQEFINGTRLNGEIRVEVFDLAIKALGERPQGEWNYIQAGICVCPFCGATPHKQYKNFCPKCGAEMKGGAE